MRSAYPAIRECHRKALEDRTVNDKPVRVQLNFEITGEGRITKLTDDTMNLNPLVSSCILRAVTAVTFQAPKQRNRQRDLPARADETLSPKRLAHRRPRN